MRLAFVLLILILINCENYQYTCELGVREYEGLFELVGFEIMKPCDSEWQKGILTKKIYFKLQIESINGEKRLVYKHCPEAHEASCEDVKPGTNIFTPGYFILDDDQWKIEDQFLPNLSDS